MSRTFKHVPAHVAFPNEVESPVERTAKRNDIRAEDTLADIPVRRMCYRSKVSKHYSKFASSLEQSSFGQFSVVGAFWIDFKTSKILSKNEVSSEIKSGTFVCSDSASIFGQEFPSHLYKLGSNLELALSGSYDEFAYAHILNSASAKFLSCIENKSFYQVFPSEFYFEHAGIHFGAFKIADGAYAIISGPAPDFEKVARDREESCLEGTSKSWRDRGSTDFKLGKHYSSHYCCEWCSKSPGADERSSVAIQLKNAVKAFNSGIEDFDVDI